MGAKGGGGSSSALPTIDVPSIAKGQYAASIKAAEKSAAMNAVDVFSPYGSTTYIRNAKGVPQRQMTRLSPSGQRQLNLTNQGAEGLLSTANTKIGQIPTDEFNFNGINYDPNSYQDPLTQLWGGTNAPFDPRGQNYQDDAQRLWQSSNQTQQAGQQASARANQLYGQAGAPNLIAANLAQQTAPGAQPYDPRTSYQNGIQNYRDDVSGAFFNRQASLMAPQFQQQREAIEQDLADRGIPITGEAYNDTMGNFNRGQSDAYMRLANDAVLAGGQEAQRQLGMEQSVNNAAFGQTLQGNAAMLGALGQGYEQLLGANAAKYGYDAARNEQLYGDTTARTGYEQGLRGQARSEDLQDHQQANSDQLARVQGEQNLRSTAIQERLLGRTQAINEASALIQGSPALGVPQAPGIPTYNIPAPDIQGLEIARYNGELNAYNAQQQAAASGASGAFGLAGSVISAFSTEVLKEDFGAPERLIDLAKKLDVKTWRYRPGIDNGAMHIGPMAEQWHSVTSLGDGVRIDLLDFCGFLLRCVQDLAADVDELKPKYWFE